MPLGRKEETEVCRIEEMVPVSYVLGEGAEDPRPGGSMAMRLWCCERSGKIGI